MGVCCTCLIHLLFLCTQQQGYFMMSILLPLYNIQQDKRTQVKNSELLNVLCSGLCFSWYMLVVVISLTLTVWVIFFLNSRWTYSFFIFQLLNKKRSQFIRMWPCVCMASDKLTSHYCSKTFTSFWVETFVGTRTCNEFLLGRSDL